MGNILRRKKYPKIIEALTLDINQLKIELILNLYDKCILWYHHQKSEQPQRYIRFL